MQSPARPQTSDLRLILSERLSPYPFVSNEILATAEDILIFGSQAAGLARPSSDCDVLVIGETRLRIKSKALDLLVIPREELNNGMWRRTELFQHIAAFGVSLRTGVPLLKVIVDGYAAEHKAERLVNFVRRLSPIWNSLDPSFRRKYLTKLRRETQRYQILKEGYAVPPTPVLDASAREAASMQIISNAFLQLLDKTSPLNLRFARCVAGGFSSAPVQQ